ncbi:PAS domain S-box protein [Ktedonobacter sp. SOSP1-52]|uniref:PAS domain S-box protein n=1 Tax=Ktedonobacter sp. SOSP1-52 TaxID=2778366 RepID=UPI0019163487|nr:PAS domain S-box protein [Ktedonobacter sp. SOSP1-52]
MFNPQSSESSMLTSREMLLITLETLPDALFVVDDATTIVYANASAQTMLGATREEVCGKPLWRCAPQLVSTALYQAVQKTTQTRVPSEVEYLSPVTQTWLHVQLAPTMGGLMVQVHQGRAAARREAPVPQDERLSIEDLNGLYSRVGVLTPEGIVLEINEVPLAEARVRREEVIGYPLVETRWWSCSPTSQEQLCAAIARASRGETVRFEAVVHLREGLDRHLEVAITPHRDAEHHIAYLVIASIDITERKRAEAELHALIDAIPQMVWTSQPDGSHDSFNQRWCDYTGLSTEEAQGEGWMQCLHPEDRPRVRTAWQRAVQTGGGYETELRLRQNTIGEYRWFLARAMPVRDETSQIIKWFGTSTDIEEKKRAEQQLKESRESLRVLTETVPQLVWVRRSDGLLEYVNQRYRDYTGLMLEQIQSDPWAYLQFFHPDDREGSRVLWQHALDTGDMYEHEQRLRNGQTGEYRWFLARAMPVRDERGQIIKWFGTSTDIEEKKRVEQQLKESREELRVLLETMPQLVWTTRPDGFLEYGNQHLLTYLNVPVEGVNGDQWLHFVHPDDRQKTWTVWQTQLRTGQSHEVEYRLREGKTGNYRWFLVRGIPFRDEQGHILKWFGTCTDIEDQKRTEEALRQSQERANVLMNSSIIGIFVGEGDQIVDANDTFLRMTGYTREDLRVGCINWMQMTPPEYLARTQQAQQELDAQQSLTPYEKEYVCKDGSRLPVLVGGALLQHHPFQVITFVLDNSARKELEQRKDDFISMASHELRNPLTALKLQTTLLHRQLTKQGLQASALSSMQTQINKLTRLVEDLLDVSKIQAGKLEYRQEAVDLDALLREIVDTMQQTHPSHTILVRGTVQAILLGDRDRLGQVFTNLLSNAIKYSPDAQTVEMDLSASPEEATIRVRDHGLGIPREQRDKIFDRFYRVTDSRKRGIPGLGMGLYIVGEIVNGHGGTITVDSDVGKGSTFQVTLPKKRDG